VTDALDRLRIRLPRPRRFLRAMGEEGRRRLRETGRAEEK
jgi:hypothetical protein